MIVKLFSAGKSFKGLGTYLSHDVAAETTERVAWTHTLNLAHDHVPSALDEMVGTARNAELLKQEAGIRAGGRSTENAVKHFSLNWSPDERPTQRQMIDATQDFLRHMKWDEHQAVLIAHQDRAHSHVHAMVNMVHPETGLKLNEGFDYRRAQAWALDFERSQGHIYCEQRLINPDEREESPTRPGWLAFQEEQKEFDRDEKLRRDQEPILIRDPEIPENTNAEEWKILRDFQRLERQAFFSDGKLEFSELRRGIYREVREEFRPQWAAYYAAEKNGTEPDTLKAMKTELLDQQKSILDHRRDDACDALRTSRDTQYRDLLDRQAEMRHGLHARQEAGLTTLPMLDRFETGPAETGDVTLAFREAGRQATDQTNNHEPHEHDRNLFETPMESGGHMRPATSIAGNVGMSFGFGIASLFDSLADGLIQGKPDPKPKQAEPDPRPNLFEQAAARARQNASRDKEAEDQRLEEERRARSRE